MKKFFAENKATIISVLTAILSLAVGLSTLDLGVKVGAIIAILVVVIPIFINILTEGFNDRTVNLIVNAVSIIQKILVANGMVTVGTGEVSEEIETVDVEDAVPEEIKPVVPIEFTKEQIKEMLLENL